MACRLAVAATRTAASVHEAATAYGLLVRRHPAGPLLGAVVLAKIVTLGLAMEAAAVVLVLTGGRPDPATTSLFAVLVVICGAMLARGARRLGRPAAGWLRPTMWQVAMAPSRPT
jgi:hypothetical protein